MHYVEVAIAKSRGGSRLYTYETDTELVPGDIIEVPFGPKSVTGIVVGVVKKPEFSTKSVIKKYPFRIPIKSLELLAWLFEFYPDDYSSLVQLLLPANFTVKPSKRPLEPVIGKNKDLPKPTPEQMAALESIAANKRILLHGDTGTGKTRVFLEAAKHALAQNKSVIILTPEIGLTPQLVTDIEQYLPAPIVLTHSAMTESDRRKAWEYAATNNSPSVYVGPRSALFLPISNIGLIVIDEAHDAAYKQGQSPRYQTIHVAAALAGLHNATLILSSATPNISDFEQVQTRGFALARLTKLAAGDARSAVSLVDITDRSLFTKNPYLSDTLLVSLEATLQKGLQSIIFLNRRGSARLVQCSECGWQALCPNCGIPLTYHHDLHSLRCHTCNFSQTAPSSCPDCQSVDLQFKSVGTKALVDTLASAFPKARIMRFDTDNSATEQLHNHIAAIKAGEVDILVGTQLITKGIDLPNLGLVGVVNADTGLNLPDYRAEELTFQQLHQVVGRIDRGHKKGTAIIQTRVPEHPVMQAVLNRDWASFAEYELHKRKTYKYPPYSYLALFQVTKRTSSLAEKEAQKAVGILKSSGLSVQLLGPSPSFFEQSASGMTWHIIAKSAKRSQLVAAAKLLPTGFKADIDPLNLL